MIQAHPFKIRLSIGIAFVLALGFSLSSCDNTQTVDVQLVKDVQWLPDGNSMLALVERASQGTASSSTYDAFDLYRVSADGRIGDKIGLPSPVYLGYVPGVLISSDGSRALLESGQNIARVDIGSGVSTIVLPKTYLLTASPDQRYIVTTSDGGTAVKLCVVYDVSQLPARRVSQFNAVNSENYAGMWLDSGRFVLTQYDSTHTDYLAIYDTLGRLVQTIDNAQAPFHGSRYVAQTRELFVLDRLNHGVRINASTGERLTIVPTSSVNSMDAASDGSVVAFSALDTNSNRILRAVEVATLTQKDFSAGAITVAVAPSGNRIAYIRYSDPYNQDIKVEAISFP